MYTSKITQYKGRDKNTCKGAGNAELQSYTERFCTRKTLYNNALQWLNLLAAKVLYRIGAYKDFHPNPHPSTYSIKSRKGCVEREMQKQFKIPSSPLAAEAAPGPIG